MVRELNARGVPLFRCDAAEFPQTLALAARLQERWTGYLRSEHREVRLESIRSVYYRRPTRFAFPPDMKGPARRFAESEARLGFGGVLASLSCFWLNCFWLNHPSRMADAEYKPLQLQVAARCGLTVARTLVTNDPSDAEAFATCLGGPMVYKSLSGGPIALHDGLRSLYTSVVPPGEHADPSIARTAHLLQEWIPKRHDVRLTVVEEEPFAVEIHAHSDEGRVDWRADYASHEYRVGTVPDDVRKGAAALLHELGVNFGAFDFAVTLDGEWVFLEVNPNGQWGWLEHATGLPIGSAIASALERGEAGA